MTRTYQAAIILLLQSLRANASLSLDDFEGVFQLKASGRCVTNDGHLEGCDSISSHWKAIPDDLEEGKTIRVYSFIEEAVTS